MNSAKIIDKTSNKFWADILYIWKTVLHNQMGSAQLCLTCPLWYDPIISNETFFLPQCHKAGIIYPIDLCNRDGNMLTLEEVRKNYRVNLHFIDYYRLQSGLRKLIKTQGTNSKNLIPEKPIWPATLSLIHKSKKGCKDFYDVLRQKNQDSPLHTKKWEQLLQINLEPKEWQNIHLICFKTILDNHIIWLQHRIIHSILGTKVLLHKIKKSENNHCRLCKNMPKTIIHIFIECPYSTEIWILLRNWIQNEAGSLLNIDKKTLLLALKDRGSIPFSLNVIILITKKYLFLCLKDGRKPSFKALQLNIKRVYDEQSYLHAITDSTEKFKRKWMLIANLIQTI